MLRSEGVCYMNKHKVFLLNPGFYDNDEGPYFCPHNTAVLSRWDEVCKHDEFVNA